MLSTTSKCNCMMHNLCSQTMSRRSACWRALSLGTSCPITSKSMRHIHMSRRPLLWTLIISCLDSRRLIHDVWDIIETAQLMVQEKNTDELFQNFTWRHTQDIDISQVKNDPGEVLKANKSKAKDGQTGATFLSFFLLCYPMIWLGMWLCATCAHSHPHQLQSPVAPL